MTAPTTQAQLGYIAPFFIVRDVMPAIAFYKDRLGFELTFLGPEDDPYFAMLKRDGVRLMLKAITPEVQPTPNPSRHHWARWDAYVYTPDPDALTERSEEHTTELQSRSDLVCRLLLEKKKHNTKTLSSTGWRK